MKGLLLHIFLFCFGLVSLGQVSDSFNHTYFNQWQGDTSKFLMIGEQLQSNSTIANDGFYIAHPTSIKTEEWRFETNLKFNPSSTNYVDFYLYANVQNLPLADTALYLKIGNTKDEISLYMRINGVITLLFDGTDGITNSSNNALNFKILRSADSLKTQYSTDPNLPQNLEKFSQLIDTTLFNNVNSFVGWYIKQSTASFFGKHFFDNFYAGNEIKDTTAPQLLSFKVWDDKHISLYLDEKMDSAVLFKPSNYLLSPQTVSPISLMSDRKDSVMLTFASSFISGQTHTLLIDSMKDSSGNSRLAKTISFFYRTITSPQKKDLVITEIYSKPKTGALAVEAIEIYNNSENYINLAGCELSDLTNAYTFPSKIVNPKTYYIICDDSDTANFDGFDFIAMSSFPSLNDDGDLVHISNAKKEMVYSVLYEKTWHDLAKQEGGWSLELMDINQQCSYKENYRSCSASKGHSLGTVNSTFATKPGILKIINSYVYSPKAIILTWNNSIIFEGLKNVAFYETQPYLDIDSVIILPSKSNQCVVYFNRAITSETHQLYVKPFTSCGGQQILEQVVSFSLPKVPVKGSLKLAEIMFNAETNCAEYIEIDNSNPFTELKNVFLTVVNEDEKTSINISETGEMLSPFQKIVLTKDLKALTQCHPLCPETKYIELKNWATLNDDAGTLWLSNFSNEMIDSMHYTKEMYSQLIADEDGVALEKIDTNQASWQPQAWASVPSSRKYASPGCDNNLILIGENKKLFSLASPYFSANHVGKEKGVIQFQLPKANFSVTIYITDRFGRLVTQIVNNDIVAQHGSYFWEGTNQEGQPVALGIYFVQITAIHEDGSKEKGILELTKL